MLSAFVADVVVSACASGIGAGCALAALLGPPDSELFWRDHACRCICESSRHPWIELGSGSLAFALLLSCLVGVFIGMCWARSFYTQRLSAGPARRFLGSAVIDAHPHVS